MKYEIIFILFIYKNFQIAPEVLRTSDFAYLGDFKNIEFRFVDLPRGKTKESDIYSFGIIIQEMMFRQAGLLSLLTPTLAGGLCGNQRS